MTSPAREAILKRLRAAALTSVPLPDLPARGPWQTFEDPVARFQEVLESVGGRCLRVTSPAEADRHLRLEEHWIRSSIRCTTVPGIGDSTFDMDSIDDPHKLEDVGFAVLSGHFGVAENGAVWVTDNEVRHRVLYFIPQHLALVIRSGKIVQNMHEAYSIIDAARYHFCGFISGPSKTADIEQSLVIGAHGARSLIVYLVEEHATATH